MGRTKKTPNKRENLGLGNCSLSTIGEFIPLFRKKRSKKASLSEKALRSYSLILAQPEHEDYLMGELRIGSTSNILPKKINVCKISFKATEDHSAVILTFSRSSVIIKALDDISFLKDAVQTRMFSFKIVRREEYVYFKLYLISVPLPKFYPKLRKCIKSAFLLFYNIESNTEPQPNTVCKSLSNTELNDLYLKLQEKRHKMEYFEGELSLQQLKPKLRPYQEKAVRWMIYREHLASDKNENMHPIFQKVTLKSNKDIYFDKYTGWIEKACPLIQGNWKGGILADEMGLGKTVEVLALILSNKMLKNTQIKKEKIGGSDSEPELVIKTQPKKRKMIDKDHEDYKNSIKKNKVCTSARTVSSGSRKSATFQALQSIYDRTLSEYCTTGSREEPEECRIQCICGSTIDDGSVECEKCGKWQHSACLGWRRNLGKYVCPQCWETLPLLQSKATLIVAPVALRSQWCREMRTHLRSSLKVLNYEGYTATPVYPTELQNYDIVITTYAVLQAEMKWTETGQPVNLRKKRKYWPGGSPLVRVFWWRLCLDEAQTVETPGRIVSLMSGKIPAQHRWAVTGTPMAKGVTDIYGLIDYLKMEPYADYDTWKHILYDPYLKGDKEPMYNFLGKVLWRTTKESVLDQINIPQQTHQLHVLELSAVEKFYYNREHEYSARDFLKMSEKFDPESLLENLDKKDLKNLMAPLLSLRQACSDPGAVRGKGRYLSLKKKTSSMKDLLEALILKNRNDCEESLRLTVSSINGLAGIYLLMEKPEQAIGEYRKVLQLAARFSLDEKEGNLTIDKLPMIHAMYNLAEVLVIHPSSEHTLRDGTLKDDRIALEKQYIEKFMEETASAKKSYECLTTAVEKYEGQFLLKHGQWYSDGFDWVSLNNFDNDLLARIETATDNAHINIDFRSETTRTLLRKTYNWHLDLDELREALFKALNEIYEEDVETKNISIKSELVNRARDCHLRPQQQKNKKGNSKCLICLSNVKLKDYETALFTIKKRSETFEEMSLVGSWKPRFEEILLKALLGFLKSKNSIPNLIKDGENHVLLMDTLKKEFKEIRKFWTMLDSQVCARDELHICKVRLQLKSTGEQSKDKTSKLLKKLDYRTEQIHENINLIRPAELPHQELSLKSDVIRYSARLEALLGTRNYLQTLRQQQFQGENPDPCPVCRCALTSTWAILACGHTFCLECFQKFLGRAREIIRCCICRSKQNIQEVAYIRGATGPQDNVGDVIGDYSRKVEDVVRLLLSLRSTNPHVKVILFSTWSIVLNLLKKALERNDIEAELIDSSSSFENRIESFKDPLKKITVLLLPFRLGAKGLNLTEATHVILLEPVLNPADELQAIGRIHRIGQTKPTVVHKFLVRNTVEESLHEATSSNASGWEISNVTVGQLKGLFKNSPLEEEDVDTQKAIIQSNSNSLRIESADSNVVRNISQSSHMTPTPSSSGGVNDTDTTAHENNAFENVCEENKVCDLKSPKS